MTPALSSVTTLNATFAEDVAACADAGCSALEVWLTKLEDYLQGPGAWSKPEAVKQLLAERQVKLVGAAYQGGVLPGVKESRREHLDQLQKRLQLCQEFSIPTLIIIPDPIEKMDAAVVSQIQNSLAQLAELAGSFGIRLALEFRAGSNWCASVPTAVALIESIGSPHLGLCLDLYHYYTGPSKLEDLGLLNANNLFAVQLCDLAGVARELATDSDRILPGEGDFHISSVVEYLRHINYTGYVSVELMNPEIWKMKPVQVAEAALTSLRIQLGQASRQTSLQAMN